VETTFQAPFTGRSALDARKAQLASLALELSTPIGEKNEHVKTVYGWHYVRESTIKLSPINPVYYVPSPVNPPTYELIEHLGKWTVTLLADARPELIAEVKTYEEAKERMCEHADLRALEKRNGSALGFEATLWAAADKVRGNLECG
jgi:hypothetical protein